MEPIPEQTRKIRMLGWVPVAGVAQIHSGTRNKVLSGLVVAMAEACVACGAWVNSIF